MQFNSLQYIVFFIVAIVGYSIIPKKIKHLWLLALSYYFYACWSVKYAGLMLLSTFITYISGWQIQKLKDSNQSDTDNKQKYWLVFCLVSNLSILFFFKYYNFFAQNVQGVFSALGKNFILPMLNIMLPVGISFYTLQAIGYTIDVYRGTIPAEKDFFRYALFVSFFPQLVAGPIERTDNIMPQLQELKRIRLDNLANGLCLILWGLVQKVIIADRLAIFVNKVYSEYSLYNQYALIVAAVFFAFQIYCDFNAYSCIAIGSAKVLNVDLMVNFKSPFTAPSIVEFWRRWHISLSSWLRDYVYIPLGGNRVSRKRWVFNTAVVWLLTGVWHGANWTFIAWGVYNGILVLSSHITNTQRKNLLNKLHISEKNIILQLFSVVKTFALVAIGFVFFRAETIGGAFHYLKNIFISNPNAVLSIYDAGLTLKEYNLAWISVILLIAIELLTKNNKKIIDFIRKSAFAKVFLGLLGLLLLAVFGVYGSNADASAFIYFQF